MAGLSLFSFLLVCYSVFLNQNYFDPALYLTQGYDKPAVTRALSVWIMKFFYRFGDFNFYYIFKIMDMFWLVLSGWFFSKYINTFFVSKRFSRLAAFSLYFVLPFNMLLPRYINLWVPYDYMGLMFITAGLYFIRIKHWPYFYLVLFFGAFNRETIAILSGIFLFTQFKFLPKQKLAAHFFVQIMILAAVKTLLNIIFVANPGGNFVFQILANAHFLSFDNNNYYVLDLGIFEYLFRCVSVLSPFAFIYLIIIFYWKDLDDLFLRMSVLGVLPFMLLMPAVVLLFELRVYGELTAVFLMPAIYLVVRSLAQEKLPVYWQSGDK